MSNAYIPPEDANYDYTAGDAIPGMEDDAAAPPEINADDIVLSGGEAFDLDAKAVEERAASREFRDIEPGDHALKCTGLYSLKIEDKPAWVNGQQTQYRTYTGLVRFCKPADPQATIGMFIVLPPAPALYASPADYKAGLYAYVHGLTRADGKEAGWHAGVFGQLVAKLCGDYDPTRPLPPSHDPRNWKDKLVWGTVEIERVNRNAPVKINPTTGEPYPPREPRAQLKAMAFRTFIPGKPDPAPRKGPKPGAPVRQTKAQLAEGVRRGLAQPALAGVGVGVGHDAVANGLPTTVEDAGLDNI